MSTLIKRGLIVSCQAEGESPFNHPEMLYAFAKAAQMGGAVAVRLEGINNIKYIAGKISIPVIGIIKGEYDNGEVLITPGLSEAMEIAKNGAQIIGLDSTKRVRPSGDSSYQLIKEVKNRLDAEIFADVSTFSEGILAEKAGADYVGTTLSGYTEYSTTNSDSPDFELISALAKTLKIPLFCKGRIKSPEDVRTAKDLGAYGVVVGTTITRPIDVVKRFVEPFK